MKPGLLLISILFLHPGIQAQVNVLRGPYLQTATARSIIVRWRTNVATPSRVAYGPSRTNLNLKQDDTATTTEHIVQLSNLVAHTKYYYSIGSTSQVLDADTGNHFYTLPVAGSTGAYRIGVFGDCGNNSINQRNVRDAFLKYNGGTNLDSWILLGDNAYNNGFDQQYQSGFFNVYRRSLLRSSPLWPSPGNHDYSNSTSRQVDKNIPYFQVFSVPERGEAGGFPSRSKEYFSFDVANIHFISLDSYGIDSTTRLYDTTGPQARWLKQDLQANTNKEWVIVFFHHPPYTLGSHNSNTEPELIGMRKNLMPILERYGVDVVLAGHSHVYERSGLQKGFFGKQNDFSSSYLLTSSSGTYNGTANSCAYVKGADNKGTVYVVTGSAGQLGGQEPGYPLPNMKYSSNTVGGAVMIEVNGNRLDLKWIAANSTIPDQVTLMKNVNRKLSYTLTEGDTLRLTASFNSTYDWNLVVSRNKSILISPTAGTYSLTVKDNLGCVADTFQVTVQPNRDSALLNLSARFQNKKTVLVNWQYPTDKEDRIGRYVVERSANNISFSAIASVPKILTTSGFYANYNYTDSSNIIVRRLYYRIKTIDTAGVAKYSRSVQADFNGLALDNNIVIAPNPGKSGDFRIKFVGGVGQAIINVYDVSGRLVSTGSLFLNGAFRQLLPVQLRPGVYIVRIDIDDDFVIKRILVL